MLDCVRMDEKVSQGAKTQSVLNEADETDFGLILEHKTSSLSTEISSDEGKISREGKDTVPSICARGCVNLTKTRASLLELQAMVGEFCFSRCIQELEKLMRVEMEEKKDEHLPLDEKAVRVTYKKYRERKKDGRKKTAHRLCNDDIEYVTRTTCLIFFNFFHSKQVINVGALSQILATLDQLSSSVNPTEYGASLLELQAMLDEFYFSNSNEELAYLAGALLNRYLPPFSFLMKWSKFAKHPLILSYGMRNRILSS
ncbi:hypothetical protein GQR58_017379 [Nymphon striatum]|nr:hypothetical protein GQR58_017379 [Nymphon striatum]